VRWGSCRFAAKAGLASGGMAMTVFCSCAATTHLLSALTHVFPDDPFLVRWTSCGKAPVALWLPLTVCCRHWAQEKLDHVGIVALVAGTPITAIMVRAGWQRGPCGLTNVDQC
jgi:hypothetical protein